MATYHLNVKPHSRSKNANAIALASYRSGERLYDERQGIYKSCRKNDKSSVLYTELINNQNLTREQLWNAAEASEKRKNSVVAKEIEIALPCEITDNQRISLARDYSKFLSGRYNCAIDLAVHHPDKDGDERNYHAHILMTTREVSQDGLGGKWRHLDQPEGRGKLEVTTIREHFETMTNKVLEQQNIIERVSSKQSIIQGMPKKYRALPFKKYQVMRRENKLSLYRKISHENEITIFKEKKELEIEDLLQKIETKKRVLNRKATLNNLSKFNIVTQSSRNFTLTTDFKMKIKIISDIRINNISYRMKNITNVIRGEFNDRRRSIIEGLGRMAGFNQQQTWEARRETESVRRNDSKYDEGIRRRIKGLKRQRLNVAVKRIGAKIDKFREILKGLLNPVQNRKVNLRKSEDRNKKHRGQKRR
jgi:hypothetical protein